MKKLIYTLSAFVGTQLAADTLFAQQTALPNNNGSLFPNPIKYGSVKELLDGAFKVVAYAGSIAAVFFFIYAGFLYVTAGGDTDKLTKARKTFINTAIGTAILLGTSTIVTLVSNTITSIKN